MSRRKEACRVGAVGAMLPRKAGTSRMDLFPSRKRWTSAEIAVRLLSSAVRTAAEPVRDAASL